MTRRSGRAPSPPRGRKGPPTAIDLFSGAGGLSQGLKSAGFRVIGAVELDATAAETYRLNHPRVQLWEKDVKRVAATEVKKALRLKPGRLDVLAGCPPCQGFSSMRTLNGRRRIVDDANDLLFEFVRFVRALRPKIVMMENVPALARNHRLVTFQKKLERLGYRCTHAVVDAADYGVPQHRRRLIFLASRVGRVGLPKKAKRTRTVRVAISRLEAPGASKDPLHAVPESRQPRIRELIRHIPADGGSRKDAPAKFRLDCHRGFDGFSDVYGRMKWDAPSPTITGGCHNPSKGRFLHPTHDRAITLREAALLQSFPKGYRFSLIRGKEHAALLIGNALPPALIRRVAVSLSKALDAHVQGQSQKKRKKRS